jgi:DNA repair protein RAD50
MAVKSQYLQKREAKSSEMLEAMSVYNKSSGYSISIQDSLRQMKVDLAEEKFNDIEKRLLELEIKYNLTRDMALEIGEKHDALEEALMKYHHEKMKEINKTLSDFWKMTYKGNDIDAIEIKSDVERSATNSRIRSYNYRIVLKTADDTELDMRGRCSAGQKVLSSIIIRLSLAETFCANCGILALDEPTTNLDVDNIEGLANALIEIIESRKRQENFQLIVITHD